jgi:hypothetical protein
MSAEPARAQPVPSGFVEIACDESGFSGTNLLDQDTRVFTHASVRLSPEEAQRCVDLVRESSPYPAGEYKSAQLLRPAQRPVLTWLLGPGGPIHHRAAVQLTDKGFLLAGRLGAVFGGELGYVTGTSLDRDRRVKALALVLHHQGPATFGRSEWDSLLQAFIELLRSKNRGQFAVRADLFLAVVTDFPPVHPAQPINAALRLIRAGRARLEALQDRLFDDRTLVPPLEVLIPALLETTLYWSAGRRPIAIVHDEQSALTRHRVAQLNRLLAAGAQPGGEHQPELLAVRQTDSRSDPRVQVADLLAGAARQIATAELHGRGDPALTALLRPYLKPHSIWSHPTSWFRLTG